MVGTLGRERARLLVLTGAPGSGKSAILDALASAVACVPKPARKVLADDERRMSFADTIPFHEAIVRAYERSGYELLAVARGSIAARAAAVRAFVRAGG